MTTELLTKAINSSEDKVKQWGLCYLIRKMMVSHAKRLCFSSIEELRESLCAQCELLNAKKQDLPDSMMSVALACNDKHTADFHHVICDNISRHLKEPDCSTVIDNGSLRLHFSRLLYSRNPLSYQVLYRLCHSLIVALQVRASAPSARWMLLYSADELARELTLRLRVMPGSAVREFDASTTLTLAIAEYAGVERCARHSGESYALNLVIPELIEARRRSGLETGTQIAGRAQRAARSSCSSSSASTPASSDPDAHRSAKRHKRSDDSDRGSLIFGNHHRGEQSREKGREDTSNKMHSSEMAKLNQICMDLGI